MATMGERLNNIEAKLGSGRDDGQDLDWHKKCFAGILRGN